LRWRQQGRKAGHTGGHPLEHDPPCSHQLVGHGHTKHRCASVLARVTMCKRGRQVLALSPVVIPGPDAAGHLRNVEIKLGLGVRRAPKQRLQPSHALPEPPGPRNWKRRIPSPRGEARVRQELGLGLLRSAKPQSLGAPAQTCAGAAGTAGIQSPAGRARRRLWRATWGAVVMDSLPSGQARNFRALKVGVSTRSFWTSGDQISKPLQVRTCEDN
jgi:hypothetical protein